VQPVHDQDNGTRPRVVQPAVEGVVVPLVGGLPLGLRHDLLGFQRIVDDDDVRTPAGQHFADRGGEPAALRRRPNSDTAWRCAERRVAKTCRYQSLARICRQLRDNLSARSCA
jgi:hypothetical protein